MEKLCFSDLSDYLSDTYPYRAPHYFEPRELKSVYYDENYISVGWEIQWYAGGVHNEWWESVNINRETLSEVSISNVLGEDAKAIIDRALEESIASNESGFEYDLESVTFFFDEGTIYIGFGSGSLAGISWYVLIKIPR